MSFGSGGSSSTKGTQNGGWGGRQNPSDPFNPMNTGGAPFTPRSPMGSILLSGLMGLRPNGNPALSASFSRGGGGGLGRRPALVGRNVLGGA